MAANRKCLSTDDKFRAAVASSLSARQVLSCIGLVPAGSNYKTVQTRIKHLGLDTTHFTGKGWNVGSRFRMLGQPFSWQGVLMENLAYTSTSRLRNRLLEYGLKERKYEKYGLADWLAQPIPLELHYVNGVDNDNRLANLHLLCPSRYAPTENYRGRNQRKSTA